jgi:hypothetical protein
MQGETKRKRYTGRHEKERDKEIYRGDIK